MLPIDKYDDRGTERREINVYFYFYSPSRQRVGFGVEGVLVPPLHIQSRLLTADKLSAVRGCCCFCARAVGVLCVFLGLTSGSLVWWESGLQPVWLGGRGWIGGWVGSPFLSRGVKLAKSSEPSHFGLPVTNLNMEQLYLCDADSLYSTYINRTKIVNLGSYWRQSTSHTKLEESLPSRLA